MKKKLNPKTVSINAISRDFNQNDWREVENEKRYYSFIVELRKLRKDMGLTQKELAEKANLPRVTVVKVESGKRNATLETLIHMAHAMGKDLVIGLR